MESVARVLLLLVVVAVVLAMAQGGWGGVKQLVNHKFATRF